MGQRGDFGRDDNMEIQNNWFFSEFLTEDFDLFGDFAGKNRQNLGLNRNGCKNSKKIRGIIWSFCKVNPSDQQKFGLNPPGGRKISEKIGAHPQKLKLNPSAPAKSRNKLVGIVKNSEKFAAALQG